MQRISYHLLMLCVVTLCSALGFWQLQRATEKQHLMEQIRMGQQQPLAQETLEAQLWPDGPRPAPGAILADYSQYRVYGVYDPERSLLLDNRTHNGRVGYHLLTPFRLLPPQNAQNTPSRWILVNRGWIPAPRLRTDLPDFQTPLLPVSLQVQVRPVTEGALQTEPGSGWPLRIQQLAMAELSPLTGHPLPHYEFRLTDKHQPGVQVAQPGEPNMQPRQHKGYAIQWFALAVVLTLLWSRPLWWRKKH